MEDTMTAVKRVESMLAMNEAQQDILRREIEEFVSSNGHKSLELEEKLQSLQEQWGELQEELQEVDVD